MSKQKEIAEIILYAFKQGNKVLICGNGGSAAEASHMAGEFMGMGFPAIALNDPAVLTALANDHTYSEVFSRQVWALGEPDDVLITFSTSGKSKNILKAIKKAREMALFVIDWPRNKGKNTGEIQEYQLKMIHKVCELVERAFR